MTDAKFIPGLYVKPPRSGAPDFVKGSLGLKRVELIQWLQGQHGEWVNVDILQSEKTDDDGNPKWYGKINTYAGRGSAVPGQPQGASQNPPRSGSGRPSQAANSDFVDDELPDFDEPF